MTTTLSVASSGSGGPTVTRISGVRLARRRTDGNRSAAHSIAGIGRPAPARAASYAQRRRSYGGILGVGGGSSRPPRLLRLIYRGSRPLARVALVGKGITFDSGGISIKPADGMHRMTSDMSGAAAVIGVMTAVAALKLPLGVTATVPIAENLPSGSSYRPGDVLTMYGGRTVEVLNTDATLADIANVAGAPWGLTPTGGTGVPVRTIVATLESICAQRP